MKKRILSLVLVLLIVLHLILSSCGDELTAEEIATKNFQSADKALTLSLWLPTDATIDSRFETRLTAVEDAINDYLRSNNYSTKIDIIAVNENEYYEKLNAKFANIKEEEKTHGKAYLTANQYVNHAVLNSQGLYEMAYPDILSTQLDIFFIGGFDNYVSYINNGDIYALNSFLAEGQVYNGIFKRIRSIFMDAVKVDGSYYAIPNNHDYSGKGQYVLVNKELFNSNSGMTWDSVVDFYSLTDYISSVNSMGLTNVVPLVGTSSSIPGLVYLDKDNMVVGTPYMHAVDGLSYDIKLLNDTTEFKTYTKLYKALLDSNGVTDVLGDGQTAAVQIIEASSFDVEKYADEYYIMEAVKPYANIDSLYSSMFAISSHSANYQRSMDILYLLQDNEVIRTLLQYGISGEDYDLHKNENGETILVSKDTGYKMNINYTGNGYRTYPESGVPMSYWETIKESNLKVELHPCLKLQTTIASGKLSEENAANLSNYISQVASVNAQIIADLNKMTYAEYRWLDDAITEAANMTRFQVRLENAINNYNKAVTAYNDALDKYNADQSEENYNDLLSKEASLATATTNYEKYTSIEMVINNYGETITAIKNSTRTSLKDLYYSLYESSKK